MDEVELGRCFVVVHEGSEYTKTNFLKYEELQEWLLNNSIEDGDKVYEVEVKKIFVAFERHNVELIEQTSD